MASQTVFADAVYWIALLSPRDAFHQQALSASGRLASAKIVTTDEVLGEALTHFCRSGGFWRAKAAALVRDIRANPRLEVLPQTRSDFDAALAFYESRPDKSYSLTDCRSMLAMKSLGLIDVLSNDRHFTQEGFRILFA
jgi:uncharacterized protein